MLLHFCLSNKPIQGTNYKGKKKERYALPQNLKITSENLASSSKESEPRENFKVTIFTVCGPRPNLFILTLF